MVLRRSTTRCTWPNDFSNSERSTVTFIAKSVAEAGQSWWIPKVAWYGRFRQGRAAVDPVFSLVFSQLSGTAVAAAINPEAGV